MNDKLKDLIEDLRINHEFCPKEVILQAADELEKQRTWVGLTNKERNEFLHLTVTKSAIDFAKACEAKLKEKNT